MSFLSTVKKRICKFTSQSVPAYIHIPKTGGTYIAQSETDNKPVISPLRYLGHICVTGGKRTDSPWYPPAGFTNPRIISHKELAQHSVLSTVRNIFSWLVSYAGHSGGWNPRYHDPDHYDYKNARRGFDYLVKTIANRESPWPSRKFVHFQIFADNGNLVVDMLARNETLDQDLELFSKELGLSYIKKKRQRIGKKVDYRSYYKDSLIELITQTWGRELKLFGYEFDRMDPSSALVQRHVRDGTKRRVKYLWGEDKLLVDGEVASYTGAKRPDWRLTQTQWQK